MLTEADIAFFWERVNKREDGCWLWTGTVSTSNYPVTCVEHPDGRSRRMSARRFVWYLLVDPNEMGGITKCSKHSMCVNPEHLGVNHSAVSDISPERVEQMRRDLHTYLTRPRHRRRVSLY